MITKILVGAIGVVAAIVLVLFVLRVILFIGGLCGTYRAFSTFKKAWLDLKSDDIIVRLRAREQLVFLNVASFTFLAIGATIFL